ncbi:MAG: radical SAM protein [candidate division WOR-3 bacterium]
MRIDLVVPSFEEEKKRRMKGKAFRVPQLSLGILAALTPPEIEVNYYDENLADINFDTGADLVGITTMTVTAPRAYQMAKEYKKRGAKVVLGGIHPSILPHEALQYADSVVIGEAEYVWPEVIRDFQKKELKPIYQAKERVKMEDIPFPKRKIFNNKGYLLTAIFQITRGCPFNCDFCSAHLLFGNFYRKRPIEMVIKEIEEVDRPLIVFVDDNITGDKRYAKKLFSELIPLKKKWLGEADLGIADDPELLKLARRSGCYGLFIGFESVSDAGLKEMNKGFLKVRDMADKIKRIQDAGIMIEGSFIFGLDTDDKGIFEKTLSFAKNNSLALASFGILTPYPGTRLEKRLREEGRIITTNWRLYDCGHTVFKPKKMTVEELQEGLDWTWWNFYSYSSIFKRLWGVRKSLIVTGIPLLIINFSYRRMLYRTTDIKSWLKEDYQRLGLEPTPDLPIEEG